jgi:hypothetical protein
MQTLARQTSPINRQVSLGLMLGLLGELIGQSNAAFSKPPDHLTVFEHVGDMIPDVSYLHVVVPVDINRFENMFSKAMTLMNEDYKKQSQTKNYKNEDYYFPKSTERHDAFINPVWDSGVKMNVSLRHDLQAIYQEFKELRSALPLASQETSDVARKHMLSHDHDGHLLQTTFNTTGAVKRRQKRFWPALIGSLIGGGLLGTFMRIFTHKQIQSMGDSRMIDMLVQDNVRKNHLMDSLDQRVHKALDLAISSLGDSVFINRYLVWSAIVRHLQRRLDDFTFLIDDLLKHRLTPRWFSAKQMRQLHQNVVEFAIQNQVAPLTEFPMDYFQIDASFVSSSDQLVIILHVPAIRKSHHQKGTWNIYRYHPFPIQRHGQMVAMISMTHSLIAIGPDQHYKVLTEPDLHKCLRRNHHYLCESPVVTLTEFKASCIGALMGQLPQSIASLCRMHNEAERVMVMQAAENAFAVYTPTPFTAHGTCLNGTRITRVLTKSTIVQLDSGCSLQLKEHLIEVPFSLISQRIPLISTTSWDTLEVPRKLFREEDWRQMDLFKALVNESYAEADFRDGLRLSQQQLAILHEQLARDFAYSRSWVTILLITVGTAVGLFLCIGVCIWCCRRRWGTRYPHHQEPIMITSHLQDSDDKPGFEEDIMHRDHIMQHGIHPDLGNVPRGLLRRSN